MTLCAADEYDADILPFLLKEFPYLNLSSETLYNMWRQGARQLQYLSGQSAAAKKGRKNKQRQAVNSRAHIMMIHSHHITDDPMYLLCY